MRFAPTLRLSARCSLVVSVLGAFRAFVATAVEGPKVAAVFLRLSVVTCFDIVSGGRFAVVGISALGRDEVVFGA